MPPLDLSFLFPAVLTALFVFLTLRAMAFVTGILSILRLSTSIAADEARSRDQARTRADADALAAYEMPEGYGSRIELPHQSARSASRVQPGVQGAEPIAAKSAPSASMAVRVGIPDSVRSCVTAARTLPAGAVR